MNQKEARFTLAELFKAEFERKNIDPAVFAEDNLSEYAKAGLDALLAGEESKLAGSGAAAVYHNLGIQPQVLAELFQEAYPIVEFLPKLSFGSAGLGVGFTLVAPDGLDVMKMAQPLAIGAPLKQYYVQPAPYLSFGGYKNSPGNWSFSIFSNTLNGREQWPSALAERPPEADTPYWFGRTEEGYACVTPEGAWKFGRRKE